MKVFIYITFLLGFIHCNAQPRIQTREEAVALLHDLRKIHTPEGIDTLEQIELNGEKQWINIRGKNKSNPILLFIHGGPASPMMPVAWAFQNGWEDYFTVVQWDQRVSGKNLDYYGHHKSSCQPEPENDCTRWHCLSTILM